MKPEKLTVYELFETQRRYIVPLFQRPYVWTHEQQWQPLWEDITHKADQIMERDSYDNDLGSHFLGAAVINETKTFGKQVRTYEIIDGQQRLTTLQVLLAAFRSFLKQIKHGDEELDWDLTRLTVNSGSRSEDIEQYKVWPTTADRATYQTVFSSKSPDDLERRIAEGEIGSPLLAQAYQFFYASIDEYVRFGENDEEIISPEYTYDSEMCRSRIEALIEALKRHLEIVVIELERGDDPQIIFETLNARGVPLLPSDLIRNFVFLEATNNGEEIERLYHQYWLPYDDYERGLASFWKEEEEQGRVKRPRIDLFIFHYLTLKTGQDIKISHLFQEFRRWWSKTRQKGQSVEDYLRDINQFSKVYHRLMITDGKSRLGVFMHRLKIMDTSTVYPLLMYLYGEMADLPLEDLDGILIDLESYLVRRMVCSLSAKNYNRNFLMVLRDLRRAEQVNRQVFREILAGFEGDAGRWPSDKDFFEGWLHNSVYRRLVRARVRMILEALDLQLDTSKQERVHIEGDLTIEHIFPQHPEQGVWPELAHSQVIHTLGNLTLLTNALNASVSNGPFVEKRTEIAKQSRLRMNAYFQDLSNQPVWTEDDIAARGEQLFELATLIWPGSPHQPSTHITPGRQRAIDSLCDIADQNGVGQGFRTLLEAGLRGGLYPRTEASSIMYAPPQNKNHCLFTVWYSL